MSAEPLPARLLVLAYGHGLGDAVLSLPLLAGIRKAWPGTRVVYATTAPTAEWFRGAGLVDEVMPMERGKLLRSIGALRSAACDAVVDLRLDHTIGSAIAAGLSGARLSVGFDCLPRKLLFGRTARAGYLDSHHSESLRRLAEALGVPWVPGPPPVSEGARAKAAALLGEDPSGRPLVLLAPGARDDLSRVDKRWASDRYATLSGKLAAEGCRVATVGAAGEADLCLRVAAGAGSAGLDLSGRTSCEELATVILRARLLVANNSGPLHLASALGVPTVSFSGGVHLVQWKPAGARDRVLLRDERCAETLCRTCPDKGARCLDAIDVDRVLDACRSALAEKLTL